VAEETLKRLLDAEAKAEEVIARADEERRRIIEEAERDIRASEQRHAEHVQEIRANYIAQAETRAQQTITELRRRHAERAAALRAAAVSMEPRALDAAIELLTGAGGGP
jgi:V/A-type H+/Na+-transporting ATPase subunit G/H